MSSFDPDDTTPLINPQENNPNHGTFPGNQEGDDEPLAEPAAEHGVLSDDEILGDVRPSSGFQRFNPFDRVPNLPPTLRQELGSGVEIEQPEGRWARIKRQDLTIIREESLLNVVLVFVDSLALINKHQMTTLIHHSLMLTLLRT